MANSYKKAARHCDVLTIELTPDFAGTVDAEIFIPEPLNLEREFGVSPRPCRQPGRIALASLVLVPGRLDPVMIMAFNEIM
jgi:hypothetical protein